MKETGEKLGQLRESIEAGLRFQEDHDSILKYTEGVVIPNLEKVLEDLSSAIDLRHSLDKGDQGDRVFVIHYTSIVTLISMLQNAAAGQTSTLRLYDSVHFNDPDEGNYLGRNLPEKHSWASEPSASHAYVVSFIEPDSNDQKDRSNNLVFWRTYGKEGEGCSLKLEVPVSRLRKVCYGAGGVKNTVDSLLPVLEILHPLASINQDIQKSLSGAFWGSLGKIQYLYKSQAYDYEFECRFTLIKSDVSEDDICFDYNDQGSHPARVRHYCNHEDLDIKKMLISGSTITLGPCVPNTNDLRQVLEILKRKAKLLGPEIRISEIPYRKS